MKAAIPTHKLDQLFDALANEHRREIIYSLGLQPSSISQLASLRGLSLPAIHKHIKVLESAGLIIRQKSGRVNFITLNRTSLRGVQAWLNQFRTYWDSGAQTLSNYADTVEIKEKIGKTQSTHTSRERK
ncbi:MAG: metalloregulator ArsR/SmtB family transcription factor [Actinobacteria bacterium]|nr:metalloregulator ArsR/SmtB family transcription factor [Actinomycetota bacterium]